LELRSVQKIAEESSGIKLYRNGFRVYPYGEKGDDWLSVDRTVDPIRRDSGINLPFSNKNLFGFIEIIDNQEDKQFEETASREGLIENKSFRELQNFVLKALIASLRRIASADEFIQLKEEKEKRNKRDFEIENEDINNESHFKFIKKSITDLQEKIQNNSPDKEELISTFLENLPQQIDDTKEAFDEQIKENGMLRVLAGIGLVIGEFVHEIEQFDTIFKSRIKFIRKRITNDLLLGKVDELEEALLTYQSYTAYFRASVSQNVSREITPINLKITVNTFLKQIENNSKKANITIYKEYCDQYLYTCPMHPSEWLSILFNLYTNSKKAIRRSGNIGLIKIRIAKINNHIQFEFSDNGDGISESIREQIFTPFYTTSNPIDPEKNDVQDNSGTGLGLYIINKIVGSYNGSIMVITPTDPNYVTCFKIIFPSNDK
jgi:signal transduction histidine kinase